MRLNAVFILLLISFNCFSQDTYIYSKDPHGGNKFGYQTKISNDGSLLLVTEEMGYIGSSYKNHHGTVQLFRHDDGWKHQFYLEPKEKLNDQAYYGQSLDINSTNTIVAIGASGYNNESLVNGAVFIYRLSTNGYKQIETLHPPESLNGARFGSSVALNADGDELYVGSYGYDNNKGAVFHYKYKEEKWTLYQKIQPTTLVKNSYFGFVVDCNNDGKVLLVTAPFEENKKGYLYVYNDVEKKKSPYRYHPQVECAAYGRSASLSNDGKVIICGMESMRGHFSILKKGTGDWISQEIISPSGDRVGLFGKNVEVSGDGLTIFVGDELAEDDLGDDKGAVYIYSTSEPEKIINTLYAVPIYNFKSNRTYYSNTISSSYDGKSVIISDSKFRVKSVGYKVGAVYSHISK